MLDSWNEGIFYSIKSRLQSSAMKLVHLERNGEAFDSQLVIGVRESYGKWLAAGEIYQSKLGSSGPNWKWPNNNTIYSFPVDARTFQKY